MTKMKKIPKVVSFDDFLPPTLYWDASFVIKFAYPAARYHRPARAYLDRLNAALLDGVNDTGVAFLSHTKLRGRFVLRVAIGNIRTTAAHVERAWDLLRAEAARLDAELRPAELG